jgi:hypothetical protein
VVTEGTFTTQLHLRNFELWQLGLLGFVLKDLEDGLVRIGAAKSRGLGKVKGHVRGIRLDFLGPQAPTPQGDGTLVMKGAGELVEEQLAKDYGLERPDQVLIASAPPGTGSGLRHSYQLENTAFPWQLLGDRWLQKVKEYQTPALMRPFRGGR